MAELAPNTPADCCPPEQQATCCEPTEKADCCGHGEGCGCAAGENRIHRDRRHPGAGPRALRRRRGARSRRQTRAPGCCAPSDTFDGGSEVFGAALYALGDREQIPDTAALASLGCGNPTAVAELHEGETVLDLGSGGGIDVLLSAKRVGPTGLAYGLDMTDEMLALARENAAKAGVENVAVSTGLHRRDPAPRRQRRRGDLQLRDQPLRRQAEGARARPPASCGPAGASPSPT